nr:GGDEF domain-containing protein [Fimbriimonadaceae bacterium]
MSLIAGLLGLRLIFLAGDRAASDPLSGFGQVLDYTCQFVALLTIAVGCFLIRDNNAYRRIRLSATSFLVSLVLWGLADLCFDYWSTAQVGKVALCDVLYLATYPFLFAGLILWPASSDSGANRRTVWLDAVIIFVILAGLTWQVALYPAFADTKISPIELFINGSYAVMDVVMIAGLVYVLAKTFQRRHLRATFLLVAAITANLAADLLFAALYSDSYEPTTHWLRGVWLLSRSLLALAALDLCVQTIYGRDESSVDPRDFFAWAPSVLSIAMIVKSGALFAAKSLSPADFGMVVGASLGLVLLMVRQMVVLKENTRLVEKYRHQTAQAQTFAGKEEEHRQELEKLATELQAHNDRLEKQLHLDFLTSLSNHRRFQTDLDQLIKGVLAGEPNFSVLFFDLDFFREYNVKQGHEAGDRLLILVSDFLRATAPETEIYRYSGKQFALILLRTDEKAAYLLAEKLRAKFYDTFANEYHV